jgi:beta-lactam-binding protein with PASTA domain
VGTVTQQTSNTVASGNVISQDPASGSSLAEGSPVSLVISSGPQMVAVPKVEGLAQDPATTAITGAKLKVGTVTQQTSNTVASGNVISQNPASGSSLAEGSPVSLVISSGPQMVAVPKVEGLAQDAATTAITGAKLKVGTITQQASDTVVSGNVIRPDPASGSSVAEGSPVKLVISSGPQMVAVPNVEGLTLDAATIAITGANLKVGTVSTTAKVTSQDPASGSSVAEGSRVNLIISSGPQMVTVPSVERLTLDDATTAITAAKLAVGNVTRQASNTVVTGIIISQDPVNGSSVAEGSPVKLVISSGPQMVVVPDVEGLPQAAATATVTEAKLKVGTVTQQTSDTVATGNVISQDAASGSSMAEGSRVNLVISSGPQNATSSEPQKTTVPNVEKLTQDDATTGITAAKLKVGNVTQQASNTVATGIVISQDPANGNLVAEGSPVELVISSGPQMVVMPSVEGLPQAAATTTITEAKLKVGTVTQQTSNTVTTGNVISQDPASGSSVAEGSQVNLVISSGP